MRLGKRAVRHRNEAVDARARDRARVSAEVDALARATGLSRRNAARRLNDGPSSTARARDLRSIIDAPPSAAQRVFNQPLLVRHIAEGVTSDRDLAVMAGTSRAFRNAAANARRPTCIVTATQRVRKHVHTKRNPFGGRPFETGPRTGIDRRDGMIITQVPNTFVSSFPTKKDLVHRLESVLTRERTLPAAFFLGESYPPARAYLRKLRLAYQGIALLCPDERILTDIRDWYDLRKAGFSSRALKKRGAGTIPEFANTMTYWALYIVMQLAGVLNATTMHPHGAAASFKARWR